jgi:hypothetical protein
MPDDVNSVTTQTTEKTVKTTIFAIAAVKLSLGGEGGMSSNISSNINNIDF